MRWSIVRLITMREIRDLLRDRRTLFLILGLPVLLYPVFALVGFLFAASLLEQKVIIGISDADVLPQPREHPEAFVIGAVAQVEAERRFDDPPLLINGAFATNLLSGGAPALGTIDLRLLSNAEETVVQQRVVDALVIIPADFQEIVQRGERPPIRIVGREGDEASKLAVKRVAGILEKWNEKWKEVRFAREGKAIDFDKPLQIIDPQDAKPLSAKTADELRDVLVKFFPFLLVMWTMAGALHPAIDLTAGEKERGTMETLLISPAERREIVAGKFFAIGIFSYVTAVWNVLWMGGGGVLLGYFLPFPILSLGGLAWSILFALPLAAMFSGIAIGLGVFARSTKEGQYYLLPMFLLVMPLTLWSLTPGLKLSWGLCLVPVTGLSLILQRLMSISGEPVPILYWILVFASLVVCMLLSLWWAACQFRRESVLFREAEQLSLGGVLRSFFRRDE